MHFMILALMWGLIPTAARANEDVEEWDAEQEGCEGVSCDDAFEADLLINRVEVHDPYLLNWKNFHPSLVAQGACSHYHWKVEGETAKLKDLKVTWHDNIPWRPLCLSPEPNPLRPAFRAETDFEKEGWPSVQPTLLPKTAEVRRSPSQRVIKTPTKSWRESKRWSFDEWKFDELSCAIGGFLMALIMSLAFYGPRRRSR